MNHLDLWAVGMDIGRGAVADATSMKAFKQLGVQHITREFAPLEPDDVYVEHYVSQGRTEEMEKRLARAE